MLAIQFHHSKVSCQSQAVDFEEFPKYSCNLTYLLHKHTLAPATLKEVNKWYSFQIYQTKVNLIILLAGHNNYLLLKKKQILRFLTHFVVNSIFLIFLKSNRQIAQMFGIGSKGIVFF